MNTKGVNFQPSERGQFSTAVDSDLGRTANMSYKQWHDWVSRVIDFIKVCPNLPTAPD